MPHPRLWLLHYGTHQTVWFQPPLSQKADRCALEGKASREWVDSTFERLDREIREAQAKLLSQEEHLNSTFNQLNEDVEGKLDRLELEPLKQYFGRLQLGARMRVSKSARCCHTHPPLLAQSGGSKLTLIIFSAHKHVDLNSCSVAGSSLPYICHFP